MARLPNLNKEDYFWLADGKTLKNLHDLHNAFQTMDEDTFQHHVNEQKNDFHHWVKDSHNDKKLADDLLTIVGKDNATLIVRQRIKEILQKEKIKTVPTPDRRNNKRKKISSAVPKAKILSKTQESKDQTKEKKAFHKSHKGHVLMALGATLLLFVFFVGTTSQVAHITGSTVGTPDPEMQFIGLWGIIAIIALLLFALHGVREHHDKKVELETES